MMSAKALSPLFRKKRNRMGQSYFWNEFFLFFFGREEVCFLFSSSWENQMDWKNHQLLIPRAPTRYVCETQIIEKLITSARRRCWQRCDSTPTKYIRNANRLSPHFFFYTHPHMRCVCVNTKKKGDEAIPL